MVAIQAPAIVSKVEWHRGPIPACATICQVKFLRNKLDEQIAAFLRRFLRPCDLAQVVAHSHSVASVKGDP